MKRFFFLFVAVCLISSLYASSVEDKYIMKTFENGQLYFILPYDIPVQTSKAKALSADITYLTTSDSVTMNISVWTDRELATDSIALEGGERIVIKDFQTFFIEPEGKLWLHRYSLRYPLVCLTKLYAAESPFSMIIYTREQEMAYGYSSKVWSKERAWMNKILHTIDSNRRLYK